jgi:hypothetical protein
MHSKRMRAGLTAIIAAAGTAVFMVLGTAGAASAAPKTPAAPANSDSCGVSVQATTSGAFSNNQDLLGPGVVPGSVFVVATQGTGGINPPVDTFGPGTGYTVSADWSTVILQSPYAGSNDGFTTYYKVFVNPCHLALTTGTSGAFSNNQDVITADHIVPGSVSVVATQGTGGINPSVNSPNPFGLTGYSVAYYTGGATATLNSPWAGSNDGFTTYYTTYQIPPPPVNPSVLRAAYLSGPWYHRVWLIANVAGGRNRFANVSIYRPRLHRFAWLAKVFVPAYSAVRFTTYHGSLLRVGYWNGYGVHVYTYAHS